MSLDEDKVAAYLHHTRVFPHEPCEARVGDQWVAGEILNRDGPMLRVRVDGREFWCDQSDVR